MSTAEVTPPPSLRALVVEELNQSRSPDPAQVALEILERVPEELVFDYFKETMTAFVRQVASLERSKQQRTSSFGHPRVVSGQGRSRDATIREYWRTQLRQRYPSGRGTWKFLEDFTASDLNYAIHQRELHAARTQHEADRLRKLREALDEHSAGLVRDLPDEVLAQIWA